MKIVDYSIVSDEKQSIVTEIVREAIEKGRQPFGSLCVASEFAYRGCGTPFFSQAMVKYEEVQITGEPTKTIRKQTSDFVDTINAMISKMETDKQ